MYYLSRGEKIMHGLIYVVLTILTAIFLIPFLTIVAKSFTSEREYLSRGAFILIPREINLTAYRLLFARQEAILRAYLVTLFRVVIGVPLNLLFTASLAYMLARRNLPGRALFNVLIFFTMLFSGGLVPTYLLVESLGLINSLWALVIPSLISPWNLMIMRNFFMGIPQEIEEAAIMDGADPLTILLRIIVPLAAPVIATVGLFYAVWHWNEWFDATIYIRDVRRLPIIVRLRIVMEQGLMRDTTQVYDEWQEVPPGPVLTAALIVVVTVPILVVYPFIQRYFVKGTLVGSIKG